MTNELLAAVAAYKQRGVALPYELEKPYKAYLRQRRKDMLMKTLTGIVLLLVACVAAVVGYHHVVVLPMQQELNQYRYADRLDQLEQSMQLYAPLSQSVAEHTKLLQGIQKILQLADQRAVQLNTRLTVLENDAAERPADSSAADAPAEAR